RTRASPDVSETVGGEMDAHEVYKRLRADVEAEGEGISLDDQEYRDLMDSFGLFENRLEDEPTIEELLAGTDPGVDESVTRVVMADGSPGVSDGRDDDGLANRRERVAGATENAPDVPETDSSSGDGPGAETDTSPGGEQTPESDVDSSAEGEPDVEPPEEGEPDGDSSAEGESDRNPTASPGETTGRDPTSADGTRAGVGHTPATADDDDGVVDRLVEELEQGTVDDDQLATLREALGVQQRESVRTQVSHLQSQMAEMEAYVDALEEFINEHGEGRALIEEFSAELSETRSSLSDLRSTVGRLQSSVEAGREERTDLQSSLDAVETRLDEFEDAVPVEEDVAALADRVDGLEASVDAEVGELADELAAVQETAESNAAWRRQVVDAVYDASEGAGGGAETESDDDDPSDP
ncbi:MAG: hypothetical protein V5A37_07080, partial [Halobacteriales archaeon]